LTSGNFRIVSDTLVSNYTATAYLILANKISDLMTDRHRDGNHRIWPLRRASNKPMCNNKLCSAMNNKRYCI